MTPDFDEAMVKHTNAAFDLLARSYKDRPEADDHGYDPDIDYANANEVAASVETLLEHGAMLTAELEHLKSLDHDRRLLLNGQRDGIIHALRIITGERGSGRRFTGSAWADSQNNPPMAWVDEMRERAAKREDA